MMSNARRWAIGTVAVAALGAAWSYLEWRQRGGAPGIAPANRLGTARELETTKPAEAATAERRASPPPQFGDDRPARAAWCRVRSCRNEPVSGCTVSLFERGVVAPAPLATSMTDSDGVATVDLALGAPGRVMLIEVKKEGWRTELERLDLARLPEEESAGFEVELHPSSSLEVEVVSSWLAPIADAEVGIRVWRERADDESDALAFIQNERASFARTDSAGRCRVHACEVEQAILDVDAFGFARMRMPVREHDLATGMVKVTLNALLIAMHEDPAGDGDSGTRSTSHLRCGSVSGAAIDGFFDVSGAEARRISTELRDRFGCGELRLLLLTETDPVKYPPRLSYTYVVPAARIEESGEVFLRRVWDARADEIIRPRAPRSAAPTGTIVVRFIGAEGPSGLPRGSWGVVARSDPLDCTAAASLKGEAAPDFAADRVGHRFEVPAGEYRIECLAGDLWEQEFDPIDVSVRAGGATEVEIACDRSRECCRLSFFGETDAGLRVESMTICLERLALRDDGRERASGENLWIDADLFPDGYDVPYGAYFVTATSSDYSATGRFVVDAPSQEVRLHFSREK